MADNVNMPREHFDALTESVAGCGKMMEENIEPAKKLEKFVEKTIKRNLTMRKAALKILGKSQKKSSTPTGDQNNDHEKQTASHEANDVEQCNAIVVTVNNKRFGHRVSMAKYKYYEKVYKAIQMVIASDHIGDSTRVLVSDFF